MSEETIKGKLARQYIKEHPEEATRTIARMLRHDHPEVFKSVEVARNAVRLKRGNLGDQNRNLTKDKSQFREGGKAGEVVIPAGRTTFKEPINIAGPIKLLVMSDSHVPYHDAAAIEAAINKGLEEGCSGLYLNGDTMDCYAMSRWEKDPRERDLKAEVDVGIEVLTEIGRHFDRKWYKLGNHEERWEKYLVQRAEDLIGFTEFELRSVLHLDELGFEYIESKQWAELGHLPILHGHEFTRGLSAPVNPARGLWNRTHSTGMVGHLHRSSTHTEKMSIGGQVISCWSLGCTCNLRPDYAVLNKWTQGFAIVDVAKSGEYDVSNYQFIEGKVYRA